MLWFNEKLYLVYLLPIISSTDCSSTYPWAWVVSPLHLMPLFSYSLLGLWIAKICCCSWFMHFGWESWRKMIITSYIPIRIVWTKKKLYGYWRITKDIAVYYIRQLVLQNEQIVFINFFRFRICNYIYAFFFCLTNSQKKLFACFHLTHAALETILESDK